MASPLHVLRKYQYPIMVVMGVILMVSFLIVPLVMDYLQSTRISGPVNESTVVVRWKGGRMSEQELGTLFMMHRQTNAFLQAIQEETKKRKGEPKVEAPRLRTHDRDLVAMSLMAQKARDMGVVISDATLRDYLDLLSDETLDNDDLTRILSDATHDRLTVSTLYTQLRMELLAQHMEQMIFNAVSGSLSSSTPAQNWQRYLQLHRRAVLEMLPVKVEDFVEQVADQPSDSQIQELYDKYKENFPNPDSPEPGFRRLPQADFAYLKVDFTKFLDAEKPKITEEEIQAEYEKGLKSGLYRKPRLPEVNRTSETTQPQTDGDRPPAPPDDADHTEPAPAESAAPGDTPSAAESPAAEQPAAEQPAENPASEDSPADVPPADSPPADAPPADTPANEGETNDPAPANGCGLNQDAAAPQVDESAPPAAESELASDAAEETEQPADGEAPLATGEQPPTQENPAADASGSPPADDAPTAAAGENVPSTAEAAADQPLQPAGENTTAQEPPPENKTLEEVRDEIINQLALPKAQKQRDQAVEAVMKELNSAGVKYRKWENLRTDDPTLPEPAIPTAADLATKHGLEAGHTGLVNFYQLKATPLGETSIPSDQPFARPFPFLDVAFDPGLGLYRPLQVRENEDFQTEYIVWKLKDIPDALPPLNEIREEVVTTWKKLEARKLASKHADQLLAKANSAEGTLSERLPDEAANVFVTNEFSFLRVGNELIPGTGYGELEISEVENVGRTRPDFMESVFAKTEGELGVVKNAGESTFYVFRVQRLRPNEENLREQFMLELRSGGFSRMNLDQLAQLDAQQYQVNAIGELFEEYNVVWEHDPQSRVQ